VDLKYKAIRRPGQHPPNLVISPRRKHTIPTPSFSKVPQQGRQLLRLVLTLRLQSIPLHSPVIDHPKPDTMNQLDTRPLHTIEHNIVPFSPKGPQDNRPDRHPQETKLIKLTRNLVREDALLPCEHAPRAPGIPTRDEGVHEVDTPRQALCAKWHSQNRCKTDSSDLLGQTGQLRSRFRLILARQTLIATDLCQMSHSKPASLGVRFFAQTDFHLRRKFNGRIPCHFRSTRSGITCFF
jgi:hypothetical protein